MQQKLYTSLDVLLCRKLADTLKKKTKRKKKTGRTSLSGDSTLHAGQSCQDDTESEQPVTPKSTLDSDSTDAELTMDQSCQPASESLPRHQLTQSRAASVGGDSSVSLSTVPGTSRGMTTAHHSRTSSATADLDQDSQSSAADVGSDAARQEEVRADLEAAVTQANSAIEAGIAVGDDVLQMVVDELDAAIQQAVEASISAKYSKKVRKRLHLLLQEAVTAAAGDDDDGATAFPAAAYDIQAPNQEWQTAGPRFHKAASSRADSPAMASSSSRVGSQSPQQRRRHQRHASGQAQAQGHFVHALLPPAAQYAGMGGPPPPPPPPRQPPPPPSQPSPCSSTAEAPSGLSRNTSGNAWGVSAKQCFSPQVSYLLLLTVVEFSVTTE